MWRGCFKDANATIFQMQSHDYYTDIIVDIDTTTWHKDRLYTELEEFRPQLCWWDMAEHEIKIINAQT